MDVPIPVALQTVPRQVLEEYVRERIRCSLQAFASAACPDISSHLLEHAFDHAIALGSTISPSQELERYQLSFMHKCRFLGCRDRDCTMCANNPNKMCQEDDNFNECYADNQALKSKCDMDIFVQLVSLTTGKLVTTHSGIEVQVLVVDGDSVHALGKEDSPKELLKSDEGRVLLGSLSSQTKPESNGKLLLKLNGGICRLPDVIITDKNDTFYKDGHHFSTFRIMAHAVQKDQDGNLLLSDNVAPAISSKIIVKTQRALNDFRKSEYPHYRDELTHLKYIGSVTAKRLMDLRAHVPEAPFSCVKTVHELKDLVICADQNRQLENQLLELFSMKGRHRQKWDYLHELLTERIVYDDTLHRAWFRDDAQSQGLLYACKQAQIELDRPSGLLTRVARPDGQTKLQVMALQDSQVGLTTDLVRELKAEAKRDWAEAGHRRWTILKEHLEPAGAVTGGLSTAGSSALESMRSSSLQGRFSSQPSFARSDGSMSSMIGSGSTPSSFIAPQNPSSGHSLQAMARQTPALLPQGSFSAGNMNSAQSPRTKRTLSAFSAEVLLAAAAAVISGCGSGTSGVAHASSDNRSHPTGSNSRGDAASGLAGNLRGSMVRGGTGFATGPSAPAPDPLARRRRISLDLSVVVPPLTSAPSLGSNPTSCSVLDLSAKRSRLAGDMEDFSLPPSSDSSSTGQPPSMTELYHSESRGRHLPRSRMQNPAVSNVASEGPAARFVTPTQELSHTMKTSLNLNDGLIRPSGSGALPHKPGLASFDLNLNDGMLLDNDNCPLDLSTKYTRPTVPSGGALLPLSDGDTVMNASELPPLAAIYDDESQEQHLPRSRTLTRDTGNAAFCADIDDFLAHTMPSLDCLADASAASQISNRDGSHPSLNLNIGGGRPWAESALTSAHDLSNSMETSLRLNDGSIGINGTGSQASRFLVTQESDSFNKIVARIPESDSFHRLLAGVPPANHASIAGLESDSINKTLMARIAESDSFRYLLSPTSRVPSMRASDSLNKTVALISESDSFNRLLAELAPANNDASLTASESFDKTVALIAESNSFKLLLAELTPFNPALSTSDSFNKTVDMMLKDPENDSFRKLIEGLDQHQQ